MEKDKKHLLVEHRYRPQHNCAQGSKFSELIVGLGIEMSESLREWMIGELVVNSASLEELRYSVI